MRLRSKRGDPEPVRQAGILRIIPAWLALFSPVGTEGMRGTQEGCRGNTVRP